MQLTGSLYPAMIVHFVYDSVAPFIYLRLAQEVVTADNAAGERPELPAHGEVSR